MSSTFDWAKKDITSALGYFEERELNALDWKLLGRAYGEWSKQAPKIAFENAIKLGSSGAAIELQKRTLVSLVSNDIESTSRIQMSPHMREAYPKVKPTLSHLS